MTPTSDDDGQQDRISSSAALVACECCETPLLPGTRAKVNADGAIVCVECAEALADA